MTSLKDDFRKKQKRTKKALAKLKELQKKNDKGDFDFLLETLPEGSGRAIKTEGVRLYFTNVGGKIEIRLADGSPPSWFI